MKAISRRTFLSLPLGYAAAVGACAATSRRTSIAIRGEDFLINGRPTYEGRVYRGARVEGLLMNARLIQGIFDDLNPETRQRWAYPDTGKWDPDRNTREFVAAMPEWRRHGLLSFTLGLQGGNPIIGTRPQPWLSSAFDPSGSLRPPFMERLQQILDRADQLGMAPILNPFYHGQDEHFESEAAIKRALSGFINWLLDGGYRNVLIEMVNECDVPYYHWEILKPLRVHELIEMGKGISRGGQRLLIGTSFRGGAVPNESVVRSADLLLLRANGGGADPDRVDRLVEQTRKVPGYRPMPLVINEDNHYDFEQPDCNMLKAVRAYVSWGFYDPGANNYADGFQSPPVNWAANTELKKNFFALLKEVTGS
jgi:hypothetical protein